MIGVRLHGRLGNQMFQYAFAYSTAKKLNTGFYLDETEVGFFLPGVFNIPVPSINRTSFLLKKLPLPNARRVQFSGRLFAYQKSKLNQEVSYDANLSPAKNLESVSDSCFYNGYFQSVLYFKKYESGIRELFVLKPFILKAFKKKYGAKKYIAIHIRRTDYLNVHLDGFAASANIALPISYFKKCLSLIPTSSDYEIIILSDDIEYVKKEWPEVNALYESNEAAVDFAILVHADILIISNSSFSWWGAFLNRKCEKVFAPKRWVGYSMNDEFPKGIEEGLPWQWID